MKTLAIRASYFLMLSIASMADSLIESFLNWITWPYFFVIVIIAFIAWLAIIRTRENR